MAPVNREICLLGYAGVLGSSLILSKRVEELGDKFSKRYLNQAIQNHAKAIVQSTRALDFLRGEENILKDEEWIKVEDAGVLASLYEWSKKRNIGCRIEIKKIPILQSGVEVCEFYGLNIYRLLSDCYLIFTNRGYELSMELRNRGFSCKIIGSLQEGLDKVIIDKEELEYINRPTKDEIRKMGIYDGGVDSGNY